MVCNHCGSEFDGLVCPICGHKQLGFTECPVCFTHVSPLTKNCPNCGAPIKPSTQQVKPTTPDTSVHSESSHTYQTQTEYYDYKEDAYHQEEDKPKSSMHDIFKTVSLNKNDKQVSRAKKKKSILGAIMSVFLVYSIVGLIFTFMGGVFENNIKTNATISDFSFDENVSYSDYTQNYSNNRMFVYNGDIYLCRDDGLYTYDKDGVETCINEYYCQDLYVDETGIYCTYLGNYYRINDDQEEELIPGVDTCYYAKDKVYYLNNKNTMFVYDMNTKESQLVYKDVNFFIVDDYHKCFLVELSQGDYVYIDQTGKVVKDNFEDYLIESNSFFKNGQLYTCEYDGVFVRDIENNKEKKEYDISGVSCNLFALTSDGNQNLLYFSSYDDSLTVCDKDDVCTNILEKNITKMMGYNGKVIVRCLDDDAEAFYILDYEGNCAEIE